MNSIKKLPDSELDVMLAIWSSDEPVTRAFIESRINGKKKLATTTILSLITRLIDKGFVAANKEGKTYTYSPLIQEKDYMEKESKSIVQKLFKNSPKNFLAALYNGNNLNKKDVEELEEFLKKLKEDNDE